MGQTVVSHGKAGRIRVGIGRHATMALGWRGCRAFAWDRRLRRAWARARVGPSRRCAAPTGLSLGPTLIPEHTVGLLAR